MYVCTCVRVSSPSSSSFSAAAAHAQEPAAFEDQTITPLLTHDGQRGVHHRARHEPHPKTFLERMTFDLLSPAFFQRHPHLVVAGGSVNAACLHIPTATTTQWLSEHGHDVDLFVVGVGGQAEAARVVREAVADIVSWSATARLPLDRPACLVSVTRNSVNCSIVTLENQDSLLLFEVQIIMRLFRSTEELLLFFDFGPCRFAYDGARFTCSHSALFAAANGAYLLEPAMMTYPKRVIKYYHRGFRPCVPLTPGYNACLLRVLRADRPELVTMTRLKTLVSLLAFTRLAVLSSARKYVTVRGFLRNAESDDGDATCAGISGDVKKPLAKMVKACYPDGPLWGIVPIQNDAAATTRFVASMRVEHDTVWECFERGVRRPGDARFTAAVSQVETVLTERLDLWKLEKPCVNLVASDPGSNFFRWA